MRHAGDEVSLRTRNVFTEALRQRVGRLDDSLEVEKGPNPFLEGVEAVVRAIAEGRIECRVYQRDEFHAKAYITHAKFDVVGAQALVGSSNFTRAGLTRNVELNIQVQSGREVAQLQDWFETHWAAAEDVTEDVLRTIEGFLGIGMPSTAASEAPGVALAATPYVAADRSNCTRRAGGAARNDRLTGLHVTTTALHASVSYWQGTVWLLRAAFGPAGRATVRSVRDAAGRATMRESKARNVTRVKQVRCSLDVSCLTISKTC